MDGWIKVHKQLQDHWIWQDPIKLRWWLDILLTVNFKDAKVNVGLELYECKRGQSIHSLKWWAERWRVSKDSARNFLKLLEKDGMILHESLSKSTRITVCNYDTYQSDLHVEQTKSKRRANDEQTMSDPIEEREEREKEKEECTAPITKPKKQPKQPAYDFLSELLSIGVTEQVANDWMAVRKSKGATNTKTAFERIVAQIEKSGLTADECISLAVERSWQGFNAEWIHEKPRRMPPPNINTSYERWDAASQTRYFGKQVIPYDAPPRPSNLEKWDDNKKQWIFSMN